MLREKTSWSTMALGVLLLCGAVMFISPFPAHGAVRRICGGVSLPEHEQAFGVNLQLNGMGIRTVTIFSIHIYVAGLYLEKPTRSPTEVLRRNRAKAISMVFVRNATRTQMVDTMRDVIAKQEPTIRAAARKNLPDLERRLPEPRKGGKMTVAYRPGHGLELRHNGKVTGTWNDDALAELLFRVWLGSRPADSDLKAGLLGGECD